MGIKITLHPVLNNDVEIALDVEGNTVGDCVSCVMEQYPHIKEKIFVTEDKLNKYVDILVNGQGTLGQELMYPVKDGDSIYLFVLVMGR
jgi:molybdopterin converting factor small subunit